MSRWVLHVDMDQFLAAVELLRRPELAGRPVVVGGRGDPTERAVVSTASYEARAFGIRSGMPLRVAARRCPEAVFLPIDRFNERFEELNAHPDWSFHGRDFPPFAELLAARNRVFERHPRTTFIAPPHPRGS